MKFGIKGWYICKKGGVNPPPSKGQAFVFDNIARPATKSPKPAKTKTIEETLSATSTHPLPNGVLMHTFVRIFAKLLAFIPNIIGC